MPHVLEVNAPLAWEGAQPRGQALGDAAELLEQTAFDATTSIVTVSDELRDQLIESGVETSKIHVVPNGVDAELFSPNGPARREGLEDKLVVGFVGSLKPWHGIGVLADAFRQLASDPQLHLYIVGEGPLAERVHEL